MSRVIQVRKSNQSLEDYQANKLRQTFQRILKDKINLIDLDSLIMEIEKQFFPQISTPQIAEILILTATSLVERDPIYDELATSLLLQKLFHEKIINARLLDFDLAKLSQILVPERDSLFNYLGNLRAVGSPIKSINAETTGLIPFLKIANDVTHAINRSVPDLHHLYGQKFEERYLLYEKQAKEGKIKLLKKIPALTLWQKLLTRLFETVHCSNLCTEITLNTSETETAVCNLGSIYLPKHIINGKLDEESFQETITTAMRMLDNVIDLNYYPTEETRNSNLKHRPVGLGMGGFQDALFQLDIAYNSPQALQFADEITEKYSYYAILSSSQLAKERGVYSSYPGSK
ncbi:271_t:CDS:2 [Entrophospora sp. SA101]|nr:271_t:CDS:2 [Entrophospora sp. SA101]